MIVPMKKVTLLALGSDENSALTALRRLGVMQVELVKGNESGQTQQGKKQKRAGLHHEMQGPAQGSGFQRGG